MSLAGIPSPTVSAISIGPVTIHFYALFILTGIGVAGWWASKRWVARGGDAEDMFDIAFAAVIAGIIGARIYHVAVNPSDYFGAGADPLDALKIWEGGLGIWGGVAGGGIAAWVMARRKRVNFLVLADAIGPTLFVAQAIGRLGNWANQELYGAPTDVPWGLEISCVQNGSTIAGCIPGTYQPTFLYEALWNLAACAVVLLISRRFSIAGGRVFVLYVIGYASGRVLMETMRTDPSTMVLGMRVHMLVYILTALAALVAFVLMSMRAVQHGEPTRATDGIAAPENAPAPAEGESQG
ncbi:MAG: prolipoprotein diacylglyceryl transferase [Dermabacter sp.]|nr:prolipoprotein diacylglyceryl transferase [Dermabacter sp.]